MPRLNINKEGVKTVQARRYALMSTCKSVVNHVTSYETLATKSLLIIAGRARQERACCMKKEDVM